MISLSPSEHQAERGEVELLHALLRLATQLQSNLDLDAVVEAVARAVSETFGFDEAAVYVREGDLLKARAVVGADEHQSERLMAHPCPVGQAEHVMIDEYRVGDVYLVPLDAPEWTEKSWLCLGPYVVGPVAPGGWRRGDTLFVPLRDQRRHLVGLLRLGAPVRGSRPGLDVVASLATFATHAAVAIVNAREHQQLQLVTRELEEQLAVRRELLEASRTLLGTLDEAMVFGRVSHLLDSLLEYDVLGLGLIDRAQGVVRPAYLAEDGVLLETDAVLSLDDPVLASLVQGGEAAVAVEGSGALLGALVPGAPHAVGPTILAALAVGGEPFGVLAVACSGERSEGHHFTSRDVELVQLVANMAAIALQNARSYKEMLHLASSDGLTGVHNYRHFRETLGMEVRRAERYGETFCLLMMDLDHFKTVNDTVGHQQGDEVLRAVAGILRQCSRESDYLARYGGEEFVMILPRTGLGEARTVAERIRSRVREIDAGSPALTVSVSIGVAAFPQSEPSDDGVLRAADAALLRAKAAGRNRVCLDSEEPAPPSQIEGSALDVGRRFARMLGLDGQETAGLMWALAVLTGAAAGRPWLGLSQAAGDLAPSATSAAVGALLSSTERWDGQGYPEGLQGHTIPRLGRALAVILGYVRATERGAELPARELWRLAGHELDPGLVQRFIVCVAEKPTRVSGGAEAS